MRSQKAILGIVAVLGLAAGCSKSDVTAKVRQSLRNAGYRDVSVANDDSKGVMTLSGSVLTDNDKAQAGSMAKSLAAGEVISNQIAVLPHGYESQAKTINADLDKGIGENLDAALVQQNLRRGVSYSVKNGVVTLTGDVTSEPLRTQIQTIAAGVPYVVQVVNELQVKNQRASSSN